MFFCFECKIVKSKNDILERFFCKIVKSKNKELLDIGQTSLFFEFQLTLSFL